MVTNIHIADDGSNSTEARAPTRHDANVLVGVLASLAFAVSDIVEIGHGLAECLDARRRSVFIGLHRDGERLNARGRIRYFANLWRTLAEIGLCRRKFGVRAKHRSTAR